MYKKSLFFGAAALALLVLLTLAGCSNPSSGSTEYVTQAGSGYPYPVDTVFVADRASLDGLLNDYSAETNQVRHIAYGGNSASLTDGLIIPSGKTVYLTDTHAAIAGNITVREGAKLVLVTPFTAGNPGLLLVRGTVEVFRSLTVTAGALDVADYSVENVIKPGRNTVIGKNVTIMPGAVLTLSITDLIPPTESQPNKFTPAQAWAAAGQGHLVIGTSSTPGKHAGAYTDALIAYNYKVSDLLAGVSPSTNRTYTVTSGRFGPENLPREIPAGAYILTRATPSKSESGKEPFIVNGSLTTNGTLNEISNIEVGPGGALTLTEPNGELLRGLTKLTLRPGAGLAVTSSDVSLESLTSLSLWDGSSIIVPGGNVRFKGDPVLDLTLGKNVTYQVAMSAAAKVNTVISKDASLVKSSQLVVYPGSTFTVAEGVTFRVDENSTLDVSRIPVPDTNAAPALTINGTVEIGNGTFIAPKSNDPAVTDLENLYKTVKLRDDEGKTGKILLNHDAKFNFGTGKFVGSGAIYEWTSPANTGPQIELNARGMIIRDINDMSSAVKITITNDGAVILKDKSLTLERGVTLAFATGKALTLMGDTDTNGGGAKLFGAGVVSSGSTEIKGGDYGWQAVGADNIVIGFTSASASTLKALDKDGAAAANPAALTALGQGAAITQKADSGNNLTIAANTTIALGGIAGRKKGEIILTGGANAGKISLAATTSTITTGNSPASTPAAASLAANSITTITGAASDVIGIINVRGDGTTKPKVTTTTAIEDGGTTLAAGHLVILEGATGASVQGGTSASPSGDGKLSADTPTVADTI
jgi:hypothetical protein